MGVLESIVGKVKKADRKNVMLVLVSVIVLVLLVIYMANRDDETDPNNNVVNRGQVARSVSLLLHSMEQIEESTTTYYVDRQDKWYEKYMNMMYSDTYYNVRDIAATEKEAMAAFTYGDLNRLFINMRIVDEKLLSYGRNNNENEQIKLSVWNEIYSQLVKILDGAGEINQVSLIISGTVSNDSSLSRWTAATTQGILGFEGMSVDYYTDKKVKAYVKGNQILTIHSVESEDVTYHNCWIISMSDGNIRAYIEGCIREFVSSDKKASYSNSIADIELKDGNLRKITFKVNAVSGKVLASSEESIEIENYGTFPMDKDCHIYKIFGNIQMCDVGDVLVGYDAQQLVLDENNNVCAIVIDRDVLATDIRVLIKTDGFLDIHHNYVTISSAEGMIVTYADNTVKFEVEPGEKYTFTPDSEMASKGRIKVVPKGLDGRLKVESISRAQGTPVYRGSLEMVVDEGDLLLINELPLEYYLYSVVPSEMPWTYNYEALKAQAICARSFAYIHIHDNRYRKYGAHVDDSTSYQVYNNSEEQPVTNAAVDETYGKVIMNDSGVLPAYFFSTSCGATTSSKVWGSSMEHVTGTVLVDGGKDLNLSDETIFDSFIRASYSSCDSAYPWYRWQVSYTMTQLNDIINENIQKIGKENICVLDENGQWVKSDIGYIGQVKKIETGERIEGGVLSYITVFGTEHTVRVYKEYNIRVLLAPDGIAVKRHTGDVVDSMSMLPSGFFVAESLTTDNLLSGYTLIGGGYGHGAGMSQSGANTLAKQGKTCEEILNTFYSDISIDRKY